MRGRDMTPELAAEFAFLTAYKRLELLLAGGRADWGAEPYALMRVVYGAFD